MSAPNAENECSSAAGMSEWDAMMLWAPADAGCAGGPAYSFGYNARCAMYAALSGPSAASGPMVSIQVTQPFSRD